MLRKASDRRRQSVRSRAPLESESLAAEVAGGEGDGCVGGCGGDVGEDADGSGGEDGLGVGGGDGPGGGFGAGGGPAFGLKLGGGAGGVDLDSEVEVGAGGVG